MAKPPRLSDEARARIRAEEELRLQAKLEEDYRQAVRAELEAAAAAEVRRGSPVLDDVKDLLREAPSAPAQRSEKVRVMPVLGAPEAARKGASLPREAQPDIASLRDTAVDAPRRVAPPSAAPVEVHDAHDDDTDATDEVSSAAPPAHRTRLWWLAAGALLLGAAAIALGAIWRAPAQLAAATDPGIVLSPRGEPTPSATLDDDPAALAGEHIEMRADGTFHATPRAPLMTLEALRAELAEREGEPRWPIPPNPTLDELLRQPPPPEDLELVPLPDEPPSELFEPHD